MHGVPSSASCQQRNHQHALGHEEARSQHQGGKDESNEFHAGTPTPVSFNLIFNTGSETIARLDVSIAFLHAEMRDDVHVKLDPDTCS